MWVLWHKTILLAVTWNWHLPEKSLNMYNIHSSWRHPNHCVHCAKIQFGFLCWWFADVITILSHRYMNVYFYPARELLQTCCGFLSCLGTRFNIRWELTSSWRRAGNMYALSVAKWLARDAMDGVGRLTLTIVVFDYGWRLSTMVDFCNDSPWMELVDNREKFSLFANSRSQIRVVRKVFFIGAASKCAPLLRCLRLVQIHNISPLFREMQSYSIMRIWCVHC